MLSFAKRKGLGRAAAAKAAAVIFRVTTNRKQQTTQNSSSFPSAMKTSFCHSDKQFIFLTITRLYFSVKFSFVVTITAYTSIDILLIAR
jgi:hypothetical protein